MEPLHIDRTRNTWGAPQRDPAVRMSISGRQYACLVSNVGEIRSLQLCDETNDDTKYEFNIVEYLPSLTPKLTKAGKFAVRQPNVPKRSVNWWRAQCGFRGLPVGGDLCDLQERIREHGNQGLSNIMKEAFEKMKKIDAMENDKIWTQSDNNEKAKRWPKRFLHESFVARSGPREEIFVVEVDGWGEKIEQISRRMKIHCEMRKMPHHETGQRLVVVGLNEKAVRSKFAEVDRDAERTIVRETREQKRREHETRADFETRFRLAKSKGKGSKRAWDVSGQWEISCPSLEEQWGSDEDECSLEIGSTKPTQTGLVQLYASFEFIAITGIMRFVNSQAREDTHNKGSEKSSSPKHHLPSDEDEDGEIDDYDTDSEDDGPTPAHFMFPKVSLPSAGSREFSFRWRGEETGEGEIQLYSDDQLCSMTFESPNALTGVFISDLTGEVEFKGFKERFETEAKEDGPRKRKLAVGSSDPEDEWRSRSEGAHERARVGRW